MKSILFTLLLGMAAPAIAQSGDAPLPDPNDRGDSVTIGVGAGFVPDYEGSDDYRVIPAAAIRAQVSGISISTRGLYLYADLIARGDSDLQFDAGPIVGLRLNRTGKIKDDAVDALPELDKAIEVGGFIGVTAHNLTNPYDALSFRLDVIKDVADAHGATIISPTVEFGTPLSRSFYVAASLSADWVGDDYADYYYSIDADDALASGLAPFAADGGYKGWKLGLLTNYALSGDLTRGLSLFGLGSYGRLSGDFKRSPIVDDRGSAGQWMGAVGLGYTF